MVQKMEKPYVKGKRWRGFVMQDVSVPEIGTDEVA